MVRVIVLVLGCVFYTGCAFLPYSPHTKMAGEVDDHVYKRSVQQLKTDVMAAIPTIYSSKSPTITIYEQGSGLRVYSNPTIIAQWEKGLTHNGKFYFTAANPPSLDRLLALEDSDSWRSQVRSAFVNGPFHLIEDTTESFAVIKGSEVYVGKAVDGGSQLRVYSINKFHRGTLQQGVQLDPVNASSTKWWELIDVRQDPIVFESSFKDFAKPFPARALAALYLLDPDFAKSREKTLHDEHVEKIKASGF